MHRLMWVVVVLVSAGCTIGLGRTSRSEVKPRVTKPKAKPEVKAPRPNVDTPGLTVTDPKPPVGKHPFPTPKPVAGTIHGDRPPTPRFVPAAPRIIHGDSRAAARVREKLTRVRNDIPRYAAELRPIQCGYAMQCYSVAQVRALVTRIRREVAAVFPREALASQLSLDAEIAEVSQTIARNHRNAIHLVRNDTRTASSAAEVDSGPVDALLRRVVAAIDRYLAHDVLNPTITVDSAPNEASFAMQIGTNTLSKRETTTNNKIKSVWRGRYTASVKRRGYHASTFSLDLMNDDRTRVGCTLVSAGDTTRDTFCGLK